MHAGFKQVADALWPDLRRQLENGSFDLPRPPRTTPPFSSPTTFATAPRALVRAGVGVAVEAVATEAVLVL